MLVWIQVSLERWSDSDVVFTPSSYLLVSFGSGLVCPRNFAASPAQVVVHFLVSSLPWSQAIAIAEGVKSCSVLINSLFAIGA